MNTEFFACKAKNWGEKELCGRPAVATAVYHRYMGLMEQKGDPFDLCSDHLALKDKMDPNVEALTDINYFNREGV